MKFFKRLRLYAAWVACCGFIVPHAVCAQQPVVQQESAPQKTIDVKLASDGAFYGKVVSAAGVGIADASVVLQQNTHEVAQATTKEGGLFRMSPLRGGAYVATVGDRATPLRLWADNAAPPAAVDHVLLVGNDTARAQGCTTTSCTGMSGCGCGGCGGGGLLGFLMNPWVIGAGIAAAIAIPLALDDDDAS